MSCENAGFEMVRDTEGMWKKTELVSSGHHRRRGDILESMASHSSLKCPTCGHKVRVLFKKLDDSGQILCRGDLPRDSSGRHRDYSHVTVYNGEAA